MVRAQNETGIARDFLKYLHMGSNPISSHALDSRHRARHTTAPDFGQALGSEIGYDTPRSRRKFDQRHEPKPGQGTIACGRQFLPEPKEDHRQAHQ
eukprot:1727076-Rhodomonas_salina.1